MSLCTTEAIARVHQGDAAWNDGSLILMLCRFIEKQELTEEMSDYLEDAVEEERKLAYPEPTDDEPSAEELTDMTLGRTDARATDGCEPVEPDGECEHGYPAWPRYMGVI